jgi:predicted ATPase
MGIQTLNVKGFRSLRDVTWAPGKLNVIIGPNGSGKSNLLRALALLQKSVQGELPEEILKAGGIAPLLWDGQAQELSWSLQTDVKQGALNYELALHQLGATSAYRVEREALDKRIKGGILGVMVTPPPAVHTSRKYIERTPVSAATFDVEERKLVAHEGSIPDDQTLLALLAGPFSNPVVAGFRDMVAGWSLYHDVHVDQGAKLRQATVARMDRRVAADGQNLISVLHTLYTGSRDFKRSLDDAMRAAFGGDYEELVFPPAADQRVQMRVRWRSLKTEQSAADLSDGTIRFLLLLAILANPTPGDLIAIDEPEVGLHPSMLPIIAEHAAAAAEHTQVILTTHSTQLLDAFTDTPPTTTVAKWQDGETNLAIVDSEELARWLQTYSLGALFRTGELEGMV